MPMEALCSSRQTEERTWAGRGRAAAALVAVLLLAPTLLCAAYSPPNFVVILADDLDYMLKSTSRQYMPNLHGLLGDEGLELRNFVVSMAWCCPSRASLLTGKYVHNTNITSSQPPRGGAAAFMQSNLADSYLPIWLQNLGYDTYFTGKYLNQLRNVDPSTCPKGWTLFEGMLDSYNQSYVTWFSTSYYSNNCSGMQVYNQYQTHIMRDKGLQYIDMAVAAGKPFFIELAPVAPHDQGLGKEAVPAPGDEWVFKGAGLPKSPNWGVKLPAVMYLSQNRVSFSWSSRKWLQRVRSLKALDDMIGELYSKLKDKGVLDNTYLIFTSDNGFHLGHHSVAYEKYLPYEEDVRVPFFIRGPQVPVGVKSDYQAAMVDLTATIMQLAGGPLLPHLDGVPLPLQGIADGLAGPILITPQSPPLPAAPPPVPLLAGEQLPPNPGAKNAPASPSIKPPPKMVIHYFPPSPDVVAETSSTDTSVMSDARLGEQDRAGPSSTASSYQSTTTVSVPVLRDSIMIEGWLDMVESKLYRKDYRAVRVCTNWLLPERAVSTSTSVPASNGFLGGMTCYKYVVWCIPNNPYTSRDSRYRELYDLGSDPYELNNLLPSTNDTEVSRLTTRLNAVLTVLAYCVGQICREPWQVLHPEGDVSSLWQAMSSAYDAQYESYVMFGYTRCAVYYHPSTEVADPDILDAVQRAAVAVTAGYWAG